MSAFFKTGAARLKDTNMEHGVFGWGQTSGHRQKYHENASSVVCHDALVVASSKAWLELELAGPEWCLIPAGGRKQKGE